MLNFNLLPSEGKQELEIEKMSFYINKFLRALFLLSIVFFVLLSTIYFSLDILVKSQNSLIERRKESILFKEFQSLEQEITETNSRINKIHNLQKNSIYFSPLVEEIAKIISSIKGIYLNSVEISPETESITLEQPPSQETQQPEQEEIQQPKVIQKEYLKVSIAGFAPEREQVLEIERYLKYSPYFEDVLSPVQNIISPTNINFIFDLRIKK